MNITIYEDQTGLMLYPEKRLEKDGKIVNLFNNNVDIYMDKIRNDLAIYCRLIAFKTSSRPLGYYIVYKDIYSDHIFANFKKDVDKVLKSLELQPRTGHIDNVMFENIEKFEDRYQYHKEDIDIVRKTVSYGRNLEYYAGDIRDILAFCKEILRNTNNIKISISSTKNNLGNINILINKKSSESLRRTGSTEQIIGEQREILREKKKTEEGAPGLVEISNGFDKIKKGADILKNAGYNNLEIRNEIERKVRDIHIAFPTYVERREPERRHELEKREKTELQKLETTDDSKDIEKNTTRSVTKIILITFGILTILAIIMVLKLGILSTDILPDAIRGPMGLITPEPTPITTSEITSSQTYNGDNNTSMKDITKNITNETNKNENITNETNKNENITSETNKSENITKNITNETNKSENTK